MQSRAIPQEPTIENTVGNFRFDEYMNYDHEIHTSHILYHSKQKVRSHQRTQTGFGLRLAWDRTLGRVHTRLAWFWTSREYAM